MEGLVLGGLRDIFYCNWKGGGEVECIYSWVCRVGYREERVLLFEVFNFFEEERLFESEDGIWGLKYVEGWESFWLRK